MVEIDAGAPHGTLEAKPLRVVWHRYPEFGPHNTIMLDDLPRNFLMNPQVGSPERPRAVAELAAVMVCCAAPLTNPLTDETCLDRVAALGLSGLRVRPCRNMTLAANRAADRELEGLAHYLELIAEREDDFGVLDHAQWEAYVRGVPRGLIEQVD